MAAAPAYTATVANNGALLGAAETSYIAPTTTTTIITAGGSGTKIEAVQVCPISTTVAGVVYLFLYDGTTYHLFDALTIPVQTISTTLAPAPIYKAYDNLLIKFGWSLRVSQSIAGNASLLNFHAFGGDF